MARVRYIRPIESVHGKLLKSDKVGFAMRKKSLTKYTVTRDDWSMHYSASEEQAAKQRQAKFKAVSQSAHERLMDPTKRQADEKAFKAQSKYTTLFGFVFHEEWMTFEG